MSILQSPPDRARVKEVLQQRAAALAVPPKSQNAAENVIHVVGFRMAKERYALERKYVREACLLEELTPLPGAPPFLRGIINFRGQILPVIDIKRFFDLPEPGIGDLHFVIVVQLNDVIVGILADVIEELRTIQLDAIEPRLPTLTGIRSTYLKGVTGEHVTILDLQKILDDPALVINDRAEKT